MVFLQPFYIWMLILLKIYRCHDKIRFALPDLKLPGRWQFFIPRDKTTLSGIDVILIDGIFEGKWSFHFSDEIVQLLTSFFVHRGTQRPDHAEIKSSFQTLFQPLFVSVIGMSNNLIKSTDQYRNQSLHIKSNTSLSSPNSTPFWLVAKISRSLQRDSTAFNSGMGMISLHFICLNSRILSTNRSKCSFIFYATVRISLRGTARLSVAVFVNEQFFFTFPVCRNNQNTCSTNSGCSL